MQVVRSALLAFTAQQMFTLVTDVLSYPEFLPWCERTTVEHCDEHGMVATLYANFKGFHQSFSTHNLHQAPNLVQVRLHQGPFRKLQGHWRMQDILRADGQISGVQVNFELDYEFNSKMLALLAGPAFKLITQQMMDAFIQRARKIYTPIQSAKLAL